MKRFEQLYADFLARACEQIRSRLEAERDGRSLSSIEDEPETCSECALEGR